jgi:hypothetical protein
MCQIKAVENQNTHFVFNNFFFKKSAICDIMWKNILETGRPQVTVWCMRIACCIPKTTNVHTEYVTLLLFQGLIGCMNAPHCYTCVACFVISLYRSTSLLSSLDTFPCFPFCRTPNFVPCVVCMHFIFSTFVHCCSLYFQQFL